LSLAWAKKAHALKEKARCFALLNDTDAQITKWADNMETALNFAAHAWIISITCPPSLKLRASRSSPSRKPRDAIDMTGTSILGGDTKTISNGMAAPMENVAADVNAACTGRAVVISEMPSSSRAWAVSGGVVGLVFGFGAIWVVDRIDDGSLPKMLKGLLLRWIQKS
jgi:hypothetical protein